MKITGIKINGLVEPMGYDFSHVTVSWRVEDTKSASAKESRVVIAGDSDFTEPIAEKKGPLPCSGVTFDVKLSPRKRYFVKISVTGASGDEASETTFFETGKMGEKWAGRWIGQREGDSFHPVFEKSFSLPEKPLSARLYITGLGLFEAELNGKKAGDDRLAPFFNDYNSAVQVCAYDVTELLERKNVLRVRLGNGWYKGRLGYEGAAGVYGNRFALIAEMHINYGSTV